MADAVVTLLLFSSFSLSEAKLRFPLFSKRRSTHKDVTHIPFPFPCHLHFSIILDARVSCNTVNVARLFTSLHDSECTKRRSNIRKKKQSKAK